MRTVKLRLPAGCETCEMFAQPGNISIQVVLDTQHEISDEDLSELVSRCRYDVAVTQEKRGKGIVAAHGLVNENRCHWVASIHCFILTDSHDYAMECYRLLTEGRGETILVGGLN